MSPHRVQSDLSIVSLLTKGDPWERRLATYCVTASANLKEHP